MSLTSLAPIPATGAVYALVAVGFVLVLRLRQVLNLGHAATFTWGALLTWWLVTAAYVPLPVAFLVTVLGAGLLGVLLDRGVFAPLQRSAAGTLRPLIAGVALFSVLQALATGLFGTGAAYPATLLGGVLPAGSVAGQSASQLLAAGVALLALLFLAALMGWTPYGRALRVVAQNVLLARLIGVDVERVVGATVFLAAALGAAAGALAVLAIPAGVSVGAPLLLRTLAVLALGGLGSVPGAIAGGFVLAALEALSGASLASPYRDAPACALLLVALVLRSAGRAGRYRAPEA